MAAHAIPFGSDAHEALVDAAGSASFGDVLLRLADAQAGIDEVFSYWVDTDSPPNRIASSGRSQSATTRAARYASHFHHLDPLADMIRSGKDGEQMQIGHVAARDIGDEAYRGECFDRPGLVEKISFVRTRGTRHFVLSFYRGTGRSPAPIDSLAQLAEMSFPLLRKHGDLVETDNDDLLLDRVERRIRGAYPLLSDREGQVCARTVIGMTAEAIGLDLSIRVSTVLTYRRRAYDRYAMSSAHQMIAKLII